MDTAIDSSFLPKKFVGYPTAPTAPTPTTAVSAPPAWLTPSTSTTSSTGSGGGGTFGFGQPLPAGGVPPVPNAIDTEAVLSRLQGLLPAPAPITPPVVSAAQVALPLGAGTYGQLANAIYDSQATPIIRELGRQGDIADEALAGNLAQAGLADSGTGVGQRQELLRETQGRQEAVSRDVSAAATAQAIQANLAVNQQNAQLEQQARLTNAGFDYESQVQNAANLLTNNKAISDGYLTALGINGRQATAWTSAYMNRLSEAERNQLLKDEKMQQFHGEWLNFLLGREKIAEDRRAAEANVALQRLELRMKEEQANLDRELRASQFAEQLALERERLSDPLEMLKNFGVSPAQALGGSSAHGGGGQVQTNQFLGNLGRQILGRPEPSLGLPHGALGF